MVARRSTLASSSASTLLLTDYEELVRTDHLAGHDVYYYVPKLLNIFEREICEMIVPRAHLGATAVTIR